MNTSHGASPTQGQSATYRACPAATHIAAKGSLVAFSVLCAGELTRYPDHPDHPGRVMLGGSCRACKSPLLIAATAAELAAFSGIVEPGVLRAAGAI